LKRARVVPGIRCLLLAILSSGLVTAQDLALTARVAWADGPKTRETGNVVVWVTPEEGAARQTAEAVPAQKPTLIQRNKSFEPHVLVVPVGSVVAFPNRDPFFHNVFSLFDGKRFDLGLYEAGSTRDVRFDKPGVSYIFCNIHPEMSAVVIALDTPYYAVSDQRGQVVIPNVPPGRYTLRVWYEGALPETLKAMTREITVSENNSTIGLLRLKGDAVPEGHKNLYGRDYDPPAPDNPAYPHP
jgi:plastocyanin